MKRKFLLIIIALLLFGAASFTFLITKRNTRSIISKKADAALVKNLVSRAQESEDKGDLLAAKEIYQKLIAEFFSSGEIMNWQRKLEDINIKLLFSNTITPGSILYEVKPGDTLVDIAKRYNTTVELIMKSNNLTDDKIMPGRKIKVWNKPFTLLVDKSQNTLILKSQEEIIKTYPVSTGTDNSTPQGTFKIVNKLPNPTWFKAGAVIPPDSPENILGSRWMGFDLPGYGIHGTTDPQSLGRQATQGCVRLSNSDVEELYTIIPIGTEVTVVD